jgi:hypothetical protein
MKNPINLSKDQIFTTTRILALVVIPFLILAVIILYFFPDQSGQRFAWPIKPPINAMLLAAAYAGGIYFFSRVLVSRQWHTVKAGFLPVSAFAALLGITTILHWDKFTHGSIAFLAWAVLYFTTPFLVLGAWLHNRSQDPGRSAADEALIPVAWRIFFGLQALLTLPFSLLIFIAPSVVIPLWPWTLTALTARVLGAMFILPGILGLEFVLDPRWTSVQRLLEAQFISLVMFVIAIMRNQPDIDRTNPFYLVFLGLVLVIILAAILLYLRMGLSGQRKKAASGS